MHIDAILEAARAASAANTWCFAVTLAADGAPHARLIQPGQLQPDWSLRFLSDARSRKVRELRRDPRLALAWQHASERAYVTLLVLSDARSRKGRELRRDPRLTLAWQQP